jgi:acyl carrier protein
MQHSGYETEIAAIRQFLTQTAAARASVPIDADTPLLDSGILDSLGIVQMMTFLGESMDVEVSDEDFVPENFETVASLARFVASKRGTVAA